MHVERTKQITGLCINTLTMLEPYNPTEKRKEKKKKGTETNHDEQKPTTSGQLARDSNRTSSVA